ncbi:MAG: hypothetical protein ACRED5_22060 [Propylenella sp.]
MAFRLLIVLVALLFATVARALTPGPAEMPLTPEKVEAVVTSFPLMRERLAEIDRSFSGNSDAEALASSLQALSLVGAANNALNVAAQRQGFASFLDWLNTTYAVIFAHAFARPDMDAELKQALDNIDAQQALSAEQKEQMKAMIRQSMGAVDAVRPPQANIEAVAPYHDEIEAMLED